MIAQQRKAIVIGRDGQVARALRVALPNLGFAVVTLGRPEFDLLEPATLARAIVETRSDIIINAGAYTAVDKAEDEPEAAHAVNGSAPGIIAAAAAERDCPVIHLSTDYVFDGTKSTPYLETDAVAPLGVYGASKLQGELGLAAANPRHVILRTAWVCSPHGNNFLKTMLKLGAERPVLRVVDDQQGAPTFAVDIAMAVGAIAVHLQGVQGDASQHYGTFHLASGGITTWCGFAKAIMKGAAQRGSKAAAVEAIPTSAYPTKARRPAYSKLDTQKIGRLYGVHLPQWQDSLEVCLDTLLGPRR